MSPETFDAGWLALREPVDHRSRAGTLLAPLRAWWTARGGRHVVDLGAGAGSNLRYLAPKLPGRQEWTLVDHDEGLLLRADAGSGAASGAEGSGAPPGEGASPDLRVETVAADLAGPGLDELEGAHLVTASALLDLVSRAWVEHVGDACAEQGAAALLALGYDGTVGWTDLTEPAADSVVDPADALVLDAVNRHQRGDKGFGPALGPDGAATAERAFRERGYHTRLEASPWVLGADDTALVDALVRGWVEAASELLSAEASRLADWGERRAAAVREGRVRLTVGHLDLLALPPDPGAR